MSVLCSLMVCLSDIAAFPDSVNVLDNVCGDVRTPDKLISKAHDGRHMWLAPVLPGLVRTNRFVMSCLIISFQNALFLCFSI